MRKTLIFASLIALGAPAIAKKPPVPMLSQATISASPVSQMIAGFDSDGDAVVSQVEFDAGVARSFVDGDENKDGRITLIELSRWAAKWLGNAGALPGQYDFDRDLDDAVSRAEYEAEFAKRLAGFDMNKDGALARSELISFKPQPPIPMPPGMGMPGEAPPKPPR
ncbi:EF-hand domain-containing protein [Sphingobium boeckii]|uniref:Ca2+-binding EF-hand superfamily protein n=1 Tax=Sphingobium boeckii TaxID=1082345 RepID=A0A7W9AHX8_9SPHN|nr:EF-hand domain-containing protein [Sphingobium boeckii]MBB5685779.1 Ca2+-binding EF-hand superfamily protein [Sphingobium boeckii]